MVFLFINEFDIFYCKYKLDENHNFNERLLKVIIEIDIILPS